MELLPVLTSGVGAKLSSPLPTPTLTIPRHSVLTSVGKTRCKSTRTSEILTLIRGAAGDEDIEVTFEVKERQVTPQRTSGIAGKQSTGRGTVKVSKLGTPIVRIKGVSKESFGMRKSPLFRMPGRYRNATPRIKSTSTTPSPSTNRKRKSPSVQFEENGGKEDVIHSIFSPVGGEGGDGVVKVLGRINTPRVRVRSDQTLLVDTVEKDEDTSSGHDYSTTMSPTVFPVTSPASPMPAAPTPSPPTPSHPTPTSSLTARTGRNLTHLSALMDETMSSYSSPLSFHTPSGNNTTFAKSAKTLNTGGTMRTAKDCNTPWTENTRGSMYGTPGEGEHKPSTRPFNELNAPARASEVTVTLCMLTYDYILKCNEASEIEGIVEVLESKYHRRFPALLEAATKRYAKIVAGGRRKEERVKLSEEFVEEFVEFEEEFVEEVKAHPEEDVNAQPDAKPEEEFCVYQDSDDEAEVRGEEVHDVLRQIPHDEIYMPKEPMAEQMAAGEGQENTPPQATEIAPSFSDTVAPLVTDTIAHSVTDTIVPSVDPVTPKTKTLVESYGGWQGLLPEPAKITNTNPPPAPAASKPCADCRVLRDKLYKTVPKDIVDSLEGRIGNVKEQLEGVIKENRRLKKHERVQTTALRSTSEELYQTQNQLALVQTSIVQAPEAENHLDRETIDALRTQLDELGGIKMMRDEEANRIIFELEEELDCKEKELEELKQSSLTQGEREGWEELVKMRGEEVEKTERKFMEILEGKQGEIEELQTTISRKDAQLKAGDANFKKYQETLDEVGASSSERARGEAIDLMGQLKEACEENTKLVIHEVKLKGRNEQLERELEGVRNKLMETEEEVGKLRREEGEAENRIVVKGEGEIREWKRREKMYREEIKVLNKHLENQGARVSMDLYKMALEEVEEGREESRGLRAWGEKMEERVKELEGKMVKARISAPLTPAASKSTNNFTPTPARNKLPPKTPSSRMVMAAKLKEKRRGLGSSAKKPLTLNTSTNVIKEGPIGSTFIKAKSPILMNAFMASKQRKMFRKRNESTTRGLGGDLEKEGNENVA